MNWPAPQVGQVIRYAYLWKREADEGLEEGVKDRPSVIVVAQHREGSRTRVVVAPITHTRAAMDRAQRPEFIPLAWARPAAYPGAGLEQRHHRRTAGRPLTAGE